MTNSTLSVRTIYLEHFLLFGHCEAYCLRQIQLWSKLSNRSQEEGTYRTLKDWEKDLPMYRKTTIHNALHNLKNKGVINITSEPGKPNNRRTWYSINTDKLVALEQTVSVEKLTEKETIKDNKMYFNHSIKESNLWRLTEFVCQDLGYKNIEDGILYAKNWDDVSQNLEHRPDLHLIYITKTLLRLIDDFLKDGKLEFQGVWEIFKKTNKRSMPNKTKFKAKVKTWSQAKRDRFIPRLADHLLDLFLKSDYLFWEPAPEKYFTCGLQNQTTGFEAVWLQPEHPITQENYDERFVSKLKSAKANEKNKPRTNVHQLHAGFKNKKQVAGFDPTLR